MANLSTQLISPPLSCPTHLQCGGHLWEKSIGLTSEVLSNLSSKLPATRRRAGLQATVELFESAVQEVVDETNVPRSTLREPLLSGIVRQGNSFGAPTACKQASTDVHFDVLLTRQCYTGDCRLVQPRRRCECNLSTLYSLWWLLSARTSIVSLCYTASLSTF